MYKSIVFVIFFKSFALDAQITKTQPVENRALNHYSDNFWILEERDQIIHEVMKAKSIEYYGVDFSLFITNDAIFDEDLFATEYIPNWIHDFERQCIGPNGISLKKALKKEVILRNEGIQIGANRPTNFAYKVDSINAYYGQEKLQNLIKKYPKSESQNVGLSIVVDNFDAVQDRVIVSFVFFDTRTKQLLWYMKMQYNVKNFSTWKNWSNGFNAIFFRFRKMYLDRRRNFGD